MKLKETVSPVNQVKKSRNSRNSEKTLLRF